MFLQNLTSGRGELPQKISPKVNTYLCRAIDSTIVHSKTKLFLYSKIGPIIIISSLLPKNLKDMDDSLIHIQGKIMTVQHMKNQSVNNFIFIDRPNDAMKLINLSERQQKKVEVDILSGVAKLKGVRSVLVGYSDLMMSKGKILS